MKRFLGIFIATLYVVFYWNKLILFGQVPFDGDVLWYFYPTWEIGKRLLLEGAYLLWDPYRNMGQPFLASPQDQVLYPLRILSVLMNYVDYQRIFIVFHVALAAGFGFALIYDWTKNRAAGVVAALGLGFNGLLYWRILYSSNFAAIAWIPAVVFFFSRRQPVMLGIALCLQWLGGYPAISILTILLLTVVWITTDDLKKSGLVLIKGGVLFAGLSAIQVIPFIEMLRESVRPTFLNARGAMVDSLHPLDFIRQLVIPAPFLQSVEHSNLGLTSFFVSPFLLVFFVVGIWKGRRRERILAGAAAVAFLLSLGQYIYIYSKIPFITIFRYPGHWLIPALFCMVTVAAIGASRLKSKMLVTILAVMMAADLLYYSQQGHFGWGDEEFVAETPIRVLGLDSVSDGKRLFHTKGLRYSLPAWDQAILHNWLMAKGSLIPSYGAIYGYREAASRHNLTSRRVEAFAEKLNFSDPSSPLFDEAGIEKIVAFTDQWKGELPPRWSDVGVLTNSDSRERAFLKDGPNARVLSDKPGDFMAEAAGPGLLIFSEAYYPGWRVTVDGKDEKVQIHDGVFLAVDLPEGSHQVRFQYRPASFFWGAGLSLTTVLVTVGLLVL